VKYTFADHLGTPVLQTNTAAQVVWRAEFRPYGEMHLLREGDFSNGPFDLQPLRFPGQEATAGDTYNIFRWYRAGWGRYTQADPDLLLRTATEETQWYGYALLNPNRFIDPLGLYTVSGSCARCLSLDPQARNLSEYLIEEVSRWCREKRHLVTDIRLRKCMTENCRSGRIECEECDEEGLYGYSETRDSAFHHSLARRWPNRTVHICLNRSGNYGPEGANTVVHEWAHGCGCNPHGGGCTGIPDLPSTTDYEQQRRTRRPGRRR
jgi:RHS repeat-associated protein